MNSELFLFIEMYYFILFDKNDLHHTKKNLREFNLYQNYSISETNGETLENYTKKMETSNKTRKRLIFTLIHLLFSQSQFWGHFEYFHSLQTCDFISLGLYWKLWLSLHLIPKSVTTDSTLTYLILNFFSIRWNVKWELRLFFFLWVYFSFHLSQFFSLFSYDSPFS